MALQAENYFEKLFISFRICTHMHFWKCGAPDDGSNDVSSIDLPSENLIFISVGSVSRELQRCMLKYEFWLVTISYDILRTRPHVNGLCVVFPDKI